MNVGRSALGRIVDRQVTSGHFIPLRGSDTVDAFIVASQDKGAMNAMSKSRGYWARLAGKTEGDPVARGALVDQIIRQAGNDPGVRRAAQITARAHEDWARAQMAQTGAIHVDDKVFSSVGDYLNYVADGFGHVRSEHVNEFTQPEVTPTEGQVKEEVAYDPGADLRGAFEGFGQERTPTKFKPQAMPAKEYGKTPAIDIRSGLEKRAKVPENLVPQPNPKMPYTVKTEHVNYAYGENIYETSAIGKDGKPLGYVTWSDGGEPGKVLIKHVEVESNSRRMGIATAMYDSIRAAHPDAKIETFGTRTPDGQAFRDAYDARSAKLSTHPVS